MQSFDSPDVVVVGAGAAGIGAGRALAGYGVSYLVLEARDRLGGRAWTRQFGGEALDVGCGWLHSADRNSLARLAPQLGLQLNKSEPPWRKRTPQIGFGDDEQRGFDAEIGAFYAALEQAAAADRATGRDRPAAELLDPAGRWTPLIDAISTYYNGAPLDHVSVADFDRYIDTEVNWRCVEGYGTLIAGAAADLRVKLGCTVAKVRAHGHGLKVETNQGALMTKAVVVTVPTNVLAAGAIAFDPSCDANLHAAAGLPLGLADKIYFRLDGAEDFAADARLLGSTTRRDTGSYTLRAGGRDIVEGFFGGDYARDLERGGLPAFAAAARREIADALGRDIGERLTPIAITTWGRDPLALGSYSHALPGHADDRARLAAPVDDRIFFAGEATSSTFFSTAHGAFDEGTRIADEIVTRRSDVNRILIEQN